MAKKLKEWFDKDLAGLLSTKIEKVQGEFDSNAFVAAIDKGVPTLELKDRVELIADVLFTALGSDFEKGVGILLQIVGPENPEETGMFTNFYWLMPVAKYVEKYGLPHYDLSMNMIVEITKRHTSEYAIRPFIVQYPQKTLTQMKEWSHSKNSHVRRLSCEGLRPRLPWASRLTSFVEDPSPILPILENLKDDPSKYVQKSVANCLNDILKDHPDRFVEIVEDWATTPISKARRWILFHALRKLRKQEDGWAVQIMQALDA